MLLALVAVVAGLVLVVVAVTSQVSAPATPRAVGRIDPPTPSASAAPGASPSSSGEAGQPSGSAPVAVPLGASPPVRIRIPSIGVSSEVKPIGLAPDGTLAVPQPGPDLDKAAWFENSPTPGQPGPSVLEGHVDSASGPSVFLDLGRLRPGDTIEITRRDRVNVTFTVNAVRDFKKASFPTDVVYGAKDLGRPQLRVITCSDFDPSIRHHVGNTVVFAHLTATHPPGGSRSSS